MSKHKLYRDSSQSPFLNSSMESIAEQSSSLIVKVKQKISKGQDDGDNYEICSTQNTTESENDMNEKLNFSDFLERRPYSYDEDVEILNFVLKDQNIYRVSSVLLWKYLEAKKKNPRRTYQSLKNRFLRNIKPKIFTTYRHLIKNQDQVKRITDKFPELKKEALMKQPLSVKLNSKKVNEKITESKAQNINSNEASGKIGTLIQLRTTTPIPNPKVKNDTAGSEESGMRKVTLNGKSIYIAVPRNFQAPSSNGHIGIYEKYLNCKAKNKLLVCPTCGRQGGPELELNEVQDSENENDVLISSSVRNKNSECSQSSTNSKNKISPSKDFEVGVGVRDSKSTIAKSPSESSYVCSNSPSLLEGFKSPDIVERHSESATQTEGSTRTKTTSSNTSKRKYITPEEQPPGNLTDEELECLYHESVQKCEKLISSEEEEALVKKCFKKNRRSIGFDSYVLLNKANLDSFFAKSQSPPLDSLSADPVTSDETTRSPLVENMKKMLRSRTCNKS